MVRILVKPCKMYLYFFFIFQYIYIFIFLDFYFLNQHLVSDQFSVSLWNKNVTLLSISYVTPFFSICPLFRDSKAGHG